MPGGFWFASHSQSVRAAGSGQSLVDPLGPSVDGRRRKKTWLASGLRWGGPPWLGSSNGGKLSTLFDSLAGPGGNQMADALVATPDDEEQSLTLSRAWSGGVVAICVLRLLTSFVRAPDVSCSTARLARGSGGAVATEKETRRDEGASGPGFTEAGDDGD